MNRWFRLITGGKTMLTCLFVLLVGLAQAFGSIDIKPLVSYFISDDKLVGVVMTVLGLVFAALRVFSTTPVPWSSLSPERLSARHNIDDAG